MGQHAEQGAHDVVVHDRSALLTDCLLAALRAAGVSCSRAADTEVPPAVLLLDPDAPDAGTVSRDLVGPGTRVLTLGGASHRAVAFRAAGTVPRDRSAAAAVELVRRTLAGRALPAADAEPGAVLTPREQQVLALVGRGARNEEVSEVLGISRHTVRTHVQNVLTKLDQPNRLAAVTFAHRHGLLDDVATSA